VRINASGAYYWRYLVRSFAYIDLVFVDTPIANHSLVRRLETMAEMSDLTVRIERVRAFLSYLGRKEAEDLATSAERAGPFQEPLVEQILRQIEAEIRVISKKVGGVDLYGP
jgi:pyruvate-formate lyase-activating enzyme